MGKWNRLSLIFLCIFSESALLGQGGLPAEPVPGAFPIGGDLHGYMIITENVDLEVPALEGRGAVTPSPEHFPRAFDVPESVPQGLRRGFWTREGMVNALQESALRHRQLIFMDGIELHDGRIGLKWHEGLVEHLMDKHNWTAADAARYIETTPNPYFTAVETALVDGYRPHTVREAIEGIPEGAVIMVRRQGLNCWLEWIQHLKQTRVLKPENYRNASPLVRARYDRMRRLLLRQKMIRSAKAGGRFLRGAGAGIVVQIGLSEGLKATTGMADDEANMIVMPMAEAAGMVAVDGLATTSTAASAGTGATGFGATVAAGGVGGFAVVSEATRRSAGHHTNQTLYDQSTMEMGTCMTINLMHRNAYLRDIGEISQEELMRRNNALAASARKEGQRMADDAAWINRRYSNGAVACWGTICDGVCYRTSQVLGIFGYRSSR